MKTQILQLEIHDDVTSTRDKIGWSKASRILLVWPEKGRVLTRRLDLVLIQRRCLTLGVQLCVVTRDVEVRSHAHDLKIPVFNDLHQAQSASWRLPRRLRRKRIAPKAILHVRQKRLEQGPRFRPGESLPKGIRLVVFTLAVLAVFSLASVVLPSARLELMPRLESQAITFPVFPNDQIQAVSLSGAVPARPVTVIVEGRDSQPSSGVKQFADQLARGQVTFTNLTDAPVGIPDGTVVRTIGAQQVRFVVTRGGTVPGNNTLNLPVQALEPGSPGNQPAAALQAIEGILGTRLSVTNTQPMYGGSERQSPVPTPDDRRRLQQRLQQALSLTAFTELREGIQPGDILLPESVQLSRILEETFDPPEENPADSVTLNLRLEYSALVVSAEDLQALAEAVLNANLPDGYQPVPETLQVDNLPPTDSGKMGSGWTLAAQRQVQSVISPMSAVRLIVGLEPTAARERLENNLALGAPPLILLSPAWWPRLPMLPLRIRVTEKDVFIP